MEGWPEAVNSLKTKYSNVSIFVTGSNSDLLACDKERILGGRTISFRIMPFTFAEYCEYRTELNGGIRRDVDEEFAAYMRDKVPLSANGIIHRNIIDFLLDI